MFVSLRNTNRIHEQQFSREQPMKKGELDAT